MSRLLPIVKWAKGPKRGNIVFVHGLGGHPYDTWRRDKSAKEFLPHWLARSGFDVFSYGYSSPKTNWIGPALPFQDQAIAAIEALRGCPDLRDGPVIFICHSLGGLVVKQVLCVAHDAKGWNEKDETNDRFLAGLVDRTCAVVFIGTPHTGSYLATLVDRMRVIARGSDSARGLVANAPSLRELNVSYRRLATSRGVSLQHLSFYEMVRWGSVLHTVDPASADVGLPGRAPIPVLEGHGDIAKPLSPRDVVAASTCSFIDELGLPPTHGEPVAIALLEEFPMPSWHKLLPAMIIVCGVACFVVYSVRRG